jgi:hypothetical protein
MTTGRLDTSADYTRTRFRVQRQADREAMVAVRGFTPDVDPTCPCSEYSWFAGADMEYMGLGMLVALWRYFFDVDWDVRVRRRKRPKKRAR